MNTEWDSITVEQLSNTSGKILLAKLLQKLQIGGHKVLIFSQMVFVLEFIKDLLRIKHYKYETLDGSNSASHQAVDVHRFCHMSYQRFVVILRTRAGVLGLDLPAAETNIIFDYDWNPQLRTTLTPLCAQRRY